jgi:hypothetical protein
LKTLQEMAAAIDRVLPLCEAVSKEPGDNDARRALAQALAAIAAPSFLEPCCQSPSEFRSLCDFAHIQAILLRDCLVRTDAPDEVLKSMIGSRTRDLLVLLPHLRTAIARTPAND